MPVAAKTHPINIRFKSRTPLRVIQSVKKQFSNYIISDNNETVDWFKTDLHKEISHRMTPAKTLRTLREMTGWTLADTGKKIGVSQYRVSDYESGQREISKGVAKKLAEVFKTSPAVFI
jgi:antitoxin component HigA of HigAB toxin-antitoxin module